MMTARSSLLLFLFSLLLLSSCGKKEEQAQAFGPDANPKPEAVPTQTPRRFPPSEVPADRVAFQKIAFSPELIYATTDAFLNVAVTTQEVSGIKLFYSFWVNRRLVRESEENALAHKFSEGRSPLRRRGGSQGGERDRPEAEEAIQVSIPAPVHPSRSSQIKAFGDNDSVEA